MMEMLDRYLAAVGAYLPGRQRADILAEIRDVLLLKFEERRRALGRPLTLEDNEAVLKAYGHPVAVAVPYRKQRALIGQFLLPWYLLALRVVLGITWIVDLAFAGIRFAGGESSSQILGGLVSLLWSSTVQSVGAITLITVVLDRLGAEKWLARWFARITASWRPRNLPELAPSPRRPAPNWSVAWDFIGIGLIVLWMSGATDALLASAPGIIHWRTAAIVLTLRWPLLLIMIAQTALHVMTALKLQPTRGRAALSLGVKVAALLVLLVLLRRWPPFGVVNVPPGEIVSVTRGLNIGFGIAWGVITATLVGGVLLDLGRPGRRSVRSFP